MSKLNSIRWLPFFVGALVAGCGGSTDRYATANVTPHLDGGVITCGAGTTACNGHCTNTSTDDTNCGACANACAAGQTCTNGMCSGGCSMGQVQCNGTCTDLNTDGANCGACGEICTPGQSCTMGQCMAGGGNNCAGNQTNCSGTCTDLTSDSANCGACGNACGNGQGCVSGACTDGGGGGCQNGETLCAGSCVDTTSDVNNCGGCGNACGNGQACQAGACAAQGGGGNNGMAGCQGTLQCTNACQSQHCYNACIAAGGPAGLMLFTTLIDCLETACPSTNGGICDENSFKFNANKCNACYSNAQNGGACTNDLAACIANGP